LNEILRDYLKQIDAAIDDVGETLAEQSRRLREQREAREKTLKDLWSRQRQLTTLQQDRARFDELQAENERLKQREEVLRERLRSVMKQTKALVEGMRA